MTESLAKSSVPKDRLAIATLPNKTEKVEFVEGELVLIHNRTGKTISYYFKDGKVIHIGKGQSGEVPANVAEMFHKESQGLVSTDASMPVTQDLHAQLKAERDVVSQQQKQIEELQKELEKLAKSKK